ncbi:MAG: hypothetical protein QNJ97_13745 [Myxococcota bacterium]|nr:hypothetical protein [Myxococcota bacterium]
MRTSLRCAAIVVLLSLSCEDDRENYLEGSITKSYDMSFDSTRVRLYESELSIEYIDDSANGEMIPLRVSLRVADALPQTGGVYDLTVVGTVSRGPGYGSELPELETGELTLSAYEDAAGADVTGAFDAVFLSTEGNRKSLRGGFSAELEIVKQ